MLTVTLWSPLKLDPPAGAAPAWSALRVRRIAELCHGGIWKQMVARRGNAPRFAGCEPAALLLSYRAKRKWRSTGDLHPGRLVQARLFSGQLPRLTGRAPLKLAPQRGLAPRRSA